jgi:hypothetical protein
MRARKPAGKSGKRAAAPSQPGAQGGGQRADEMLRRLETDGPNPLQAAEELDRLQAALERAGRLAEVRESVRDLCDAWAETPGRLRGDHARAWLTLVGAFDLKEHAAGVGRLAENPGLPAALRVHACRILPRLGGDEARRLLQAVLLSTSEDPVRAAAAEALGDLGDRSARPVLEALLEEDLPRSLWTAASAALDRLR